MDYKKAYLEQKMQSLNLEMNLIQMRAMAIQKELPEIGAELTKREEELNAGKDKDKA